MLQRIDNQTLAQVREIAGTQNVNLALASMAKTINESGLAEEFREFCAESLESDRRGRSRGGKGRRKDK